MIIDIYEGENNIAAFLFHFANIFTFIKYNHLLKKSIINGLRKRQKGQTSVIVSFEIDINGILTVTAKE